jgi:hypothetical protein
MKSVTYKASQKRFSETIKILENALKPNKLKVTSEYTQILAGTLSLEMSLSRPFEVVIDNNGAKTFLGVNQKSNPKMGLDFYSTDKTDLQLESAIYHVFVLILTKYAPKNLHTFHPALGFYFTQNAYVGNFSYLSKKIQKLIGAKQDGVLGPNSLAKTQEFVKFPSNFAELVNVLLDNIPNAVRDEISRLPSSYNSSNLLKGWSSRLITVVDLMVYFNEVHSTKLALG